MRIEETGLYRIFYEMVKQSYPETEAGIEKRTKHFLKKNLIFLTAAFAGMAILLAGVLLFRFYHRGEPVTIERADFGKGDTKERFLLKGKEDSTQIEITFGERQISADSREQTLHKLFDEVEEHMKGKNISLEEVTDPLVFAEHISGYPFSLSYESSDSGYITPDGSLGERQKELKAQEGFDMKVKVTADYKDIHGEKSFNITVKAKKQKKKTIFSDAERMIEKKEEESRMDTSFEIPSEYGGITIRKMGEDHPEKGVFLLLFILILYIPVHHFLALRSRSIKTQKETVRDFCAIVNMLTLFMGAGASFPTAVGRICDDYRRGKGTTGKRYAFERMIQMEQQLAAGVSQREACRRWGMQFRDRHYQKLSTLLIQAFSKGAREAGVLMGTAEEEAFRYRIDRAKKDGEEAATKLLFPMVVLLVVIMAMVMFPAILRFRSY